MSVQHHDLMDSKQGWGTVMMRNWNDAMVETPALAREFEIDQKIRDDRRKAEKLFVSQSGYLWVSRGFTEEHTRNYS